MAHGVEMYVGLVETIKNTLSPKKVVHQTHGDNFVNS